MAYIGRSNKSENIATRRRMHVIAMLLGLCAFGLLVRSAVLFLGRDNRMQATIAVMNRSPKSFVALGDEVVRLQEMTANIDSYKLGEVKEELSKTVSLVNEARLEFLAQYDAWISVKGQISRDKINFFEIKEKLDESQRLQDKEILRLKGLLDQAQAPSWLTEFWSIVISFVAGVFSSIVATKIYVWWPKSRFRIMIFAWTRRISPIIRRSIE